MLTLASVTFPASAPMLTVAEFALQDRATTLTVTSVPFTEVAPIQPPSLPTVVSFNAALGHNIVSLWPKPPRILAAVTLGTVVARIGPVPLTLLLLTVTEERLTDSELVFTDADRALQIPVWSLTVMFREHLDPLVGPAILPSSR